MAERGLEVFLFRFRVVTPLFLGGAEPNERAELRPPSIKGMLRDWYRVLVGTEVAAGEEARLFGGTAPGIGQSPFLLSIDRPLTGHERWERQRVGRDAISGLNYLGYSLTLGQENDRKAIASGQAFELRAVFPRGGSGDQRRSLLACLWLLSHLGGLGSRSRRGFGSLALEDWQGPEEAEELARLPLLRQAPNAAVAAERLAAGLELLEEWSTGWRSAAAATAGHPAVAEGSSSERTPLGFRLTGARCIVMRGPSGAGTWDGPLEALEQVGAAMQRFRRQSGVDGFPTAQMLARGERLPKAPARSAFGLPLTYRTRQRTDTFEPYLPGDREGGGGRSRRGERSQEYRRFPSPVLLHVQQIQGGFLPVVTLLRGAWPGRDVPVQASGRGSPADPENRLPGRFLDQLVAEGAQEVEVHR